MVKERNLAHMARIQSQKTKEIDEKELQPLDGKGIALAEHKRFTFDIIDTPVDPLR